MSLFITWTWGVGSLLPAQLHQQNNLLMSTVDNKKALNTLMLLFFRCRGNCGWCTQASPPRLTNWGKNHFCWTTQLWLFDLAKPDNGKVSWVCWTSFIARTSGWPSLRAGFDRNSLLLKPTFTLRRFKAGTQTPRYFWVLCMSECVCVT